MKNKKINLIIAIIFIIVVAISLIFKVATKNNSNNEIKAENINEDANEIKNNNDLTNENNVDNKDTIPAEENTLKEENKDTNNNKTNIITNNELKKESITSSTDESAFNNGHLESYPAFGENYGTLIINKIGVNAPIIFGATDETILQGVGHDSGSYFPGENGSIIMCEHNYMNNFAKLGELQNGDIIEVKTNYGDFYYKKYDEQIVMDTENSKLPIQKDKEILMIYTCYPFKNSENTQYRYVIYAEKI